MFGVINFSYAASKCTARAEGSSAYIKATKAVRQLPEYRAWSKSHSFLTAFGSPVDEETLVNDKCYWSVSVYADRPERLELWHVFLVSTEDNSMFIQDQDGEAITLRAWRRENAVSSVKP
jgi:hypothetical protein